MITWGADTERKPAPKFSHRDGIIGDCPPRLSFTNSPLCEPVTLPPPSEATSRGRQGSATPTQGLRGRESGREAGDTVAPTRLCPCRSDVRCNCGKSSPHATCNSTEASAPCCVLGTGRGQSGGPRRFPELPVLSPALPRPVSSPRAQSSLGGSLGCSFERNAIQAGSLVRDGGEAGGSTASLPSPSHPLLPGGPPPSTQPRPPGLPQGAGTGPGRSRSSPSPSTEPSWAAQGWAAGCAERWVGEVQPGSVWGAYLTAQTSKRA